MNQGGSNSLINGMQQNKHGATVAPAPVGGQNDGGGDGASGDNGSGSNEHNSNNTQRWAAQRNDDSGGKTSNTPPSTGSTTNKRGSLRTQGVVGSNNTNTNGVKQIGISPKAIPYVIVENSDDTGHGIVDENTHPTINNNGSAVVTDNHSATTKVITNSGGVGIVTGVRYHPHTMRPMPVSSIAGDSSHSPPVSSLDGSLAFGASSSPSPTLYPSSHGVSGNGGSIAITTTIASAMRGGNSILDPNIANFSPQGSSSLPVPPLGTATATAMFNLTNQNLLTSIDDSHRSVQHHNPANDGNGGNGVVFSVPDVTPTPTPPPLGSRLRDLAVVDMSPSVHLRVTSAAATTVTATAVSPQSAAYLVTDTATSVESRHDDNNVNSSV
jgi:hypothetical protein